MTISAFYAIYFQLFHSQHRENEGHPYPERVDRMHTESGDSVGHLQERLIVPTHWGQEVSQAHVAVCIPPEKNQKTISHCPVSFYLSERRMTAQLFEQVALQGFLSYFCMALQRRWSLLPHHFKMLLPASRGNLSPGIWTDDRMNSDILRQIMFFHKDRLG